MEGTVRVANTPINPTSPYHNPEVVAQLKEKGLDVIASLEEVRAVLMDVIAANPNK